jgi:hypothetical protein
VVDLQMVNALTIRPWVLSCLRTFNRCAIAFFHLVRPEDCPCSFNQQNVPWVIPYLFLRSALGRSVNSLLASGMHLRSTKSVELSHSTMSFHLSHRPTLLMLPTSVHSAMWNIQGPLIFPHKQGSPCDRCHHNGFKCSNVQMLELLVHNSRYCLAGLHRPKSCIVRSSKVGPAMEPSLVRGRIWSAEVQRDLPVLHHRWLLPPLSLACLYICIARGPIWSILRFKLYRTHTFLHTQVTPQSHKDTKYPATTAVLLHFY